MEHIGKAIATLGICSLAAFAVHLHPITILVGFPCVLFRSFMYLAID